MKLNKYIYEQLEMRQIRFLEGDAVTEEEIDEWITNWYNDTFKELGKQTGDPKPRGPPMWLAGKNWVQRAKDRADAKNEV